MQTITLVKKILTNGLPCKRCAKMLHKLEASGHIGIINGIVIADERDSNSPGMLLAKKFNVDQAPFFILEQPSGEILILTTYSEFLEKAVGQAVDKTTALLDFYKSSNELDFL